MATVAQQQFVEPSVIEWLLHDDQIMRECFRHAAEIVKSVVGTSVTAVTLLDVEHQHYRAEVGMSMPPIPRKLSLCDHAVQGDDLFIVEDALADPRFGECMLVRNAPFVRFYAAIPIRTPAGGVVGALCAMDPSPRRLTDAQRIVFIHLRAMVENDLRLRTATAIDPLTQLFNRRFMLESIRSKWHGATEGEEIHAVMVDVDWFKQYNDTYGHQAGDTCFREVASVLQSIADEHQMIAGRLGGEEFGLLLCGAPRLMLETALEDMRLGVEELAIEHSGSQFGIVTISVGAALSRKRGCAESAPREGFAIADRALYMAKERGRNRVMIIESTGASH
ncbi:MAG TPA: diguanylate cyclase [Paraburkholderia sp.]|uniref:diguanylate cyclase n=1 Tax=Paraburkholderia sp. TaxID=1926495 RepID=UPI002B485A29|nr:diguanylate cyclase [Paraburkholderia sp.]HKR43343.1 diguanylate cyclase [Paraburkholderia sp.]